MKQSLEQSSAEVWGDRNSGVGANAGTVSYYVKGNVVGFLLDADIRKVTNGTKSFDDVMRLAYKPYGGDRGHGRRVPGDRRRSGADRHEALVQATPISAGI